MTIYCIFQLQNYRQDSSGSAYWNSSSIYAGKRPTVWMQYILPKNLEKWHVLHCVLTNQLKKKITCMNSLPYEDKGRKKMYCFPLGKHKVSVSLEGGFSLHCLASNLQHLILLCLWPEGISEDDCPAIAVLPSPCKWSTAVCHWCQ